MSLLDYWLCCLSEEAGEIVHIVGKALRFGLLDKPPLEDTTNWVEIRKEVHDLIAVYEVLCDEFDRVETIDRELIDEKKMKLKFMLEYSESKQRVDR